MLIIFALATANNDTVGIKKNSWRAEIHYYWHQEFCRDFAWISFSTYFNGEYYGETIIHNSSNSYSVTSLFADGSCYFVSNDTIKYLSTENEEFLTFCKTENENEFLKRKIEYTRTHFSVYSKLTESLHQQIKYKSRKKTINGTKRRVIYIQEIYTSLVPDSLGNPAVNGNGTLATRQNEVFKELYFDIENHLLDSIVITNSNNKSIFTAKNFSFENRQHILDSIFNPSNTAYTKYTHHNGSFLPYSWYQNGMELDSLNDNILNFPIINSHNDTFYLANTRGWRLLCLWTFGCKPCYKQLQKFQKEKDSLGIRTLEKNGILIYCVNPISNRIDIMSSIADRFDCHDILFCSKGISRHTDFEAAPTYILISPSDKIIFKSRSLGNYKNVLEAKTNHEHNLQQ